MRIVLVAMLISGCLQFGSVECSDGKVCANGTVCVTVSDPAAELCVTHDQLAGCDGKPDHTRCGSDGRCYSGVCLPVACGNGRVDSADPGDPSDVGEVCDDGNQVAGDGCSSDCRSDETCGNGVVDPIKGELCDDGNSIQHDGCDSTCKPEQARWIQLPTGGPSARSQLAMAYDAQRERIVAFGGRDAASGDLLGDTWEWNGGGWEQLAPPSAPSPRAGHAMAYDASRGRIVLFGGSNSAGFLADTWEWDGTTWNARTVVQAPTARSGHAMAYDAANHVVVLFGGIGLASGPPATFTDTWRWDGTAWTLIVQQPAIGALSPMTYDPAHGRIVVFDGSATTWALTGQTWVQLATTGPPPRPDGQLSYDSVTQTVLLFGGGAAGAPLGDFWSFDGTAWTNRGRAPDARFGHAMASDPVRGRVLVFGGAPADATPWEWDGSGWNPHPIAVPPKMFAMGAARDARSGTAVIVGAPRGEPSQTWTFDDTWSQGTLAPPYLPSTMTAYDEARGVVVQYFGRGASDDVWELGSKWAAAPATDGPAARSDGAMAYDGTQVLLFGGVGADRFADTWSWSGAGWMQLSPAHQPTPRSEAAIARDPIRGQLVLFGGNDGNGPLADTWLWNGADWIAASPVTSPPAAVGARLAWSAPRKRLVLFGGSTSDNVTWEWDGTAWSEVAVANAPPPREAFAMFPDRQGTGVIVFGGQRSLFDLFGMSDAWLLRWDSADAGESCLAAIDSDGDGLEGCADPDCWATCSPLCPPGAPCPASAPRCGDGICDGVLETCRNCPQDCTCTAVCGDFVCDPSEDHGSCPGDCP